MLNKITCKKRKRNVISGVLFIILQDITDRVVIAYTIYRDEQLITPGTRQEMQLQISNILAKYF
jgi:hypothetical protein